MVGHDLNAAALFVRVVDAGTLRGAARSAGVPKSTVSRKLQALEEQLGAALLLRTTRKLQLTDAGRAYYEQAARAVHALADAERVVAGQAAAPRGRLRISAPVNVGRTLLPSVVAAYLRAHPDVEVVLDVSDRIVDLVAEGFDLAIRAGPLQDSALVAQRLGSASFQVYASPAYLKRRGRPRAPGDLVDHDALLYGDQTEWTFAHGVRVAVRGRLRANNFEVLREAAVAGLGVVRMPTVMAGRRLQVVLADHAPPPAPLHAVYPSARWLTPAARAFLEELRRHVPAAIAGGRRA